MISKGEVATVGILAILLLAGYASAPIAPTTTGTGTNTNQAPKETGSVTNQEPLRIIVSFPAIAHPTPITGRVLLFMCRSKSEQARWSMLWDPQPVFGIDVTNLSPQVEVVFELAKFWFPEAVAFGYGDMLPGTYYAQALVDLDHLHTGYHNAGNLYSPMEKCHVAAG